MDANTLRYVAVQARNRNVEVIFAEEFDKIQYAAEIGNFSIILENNNFTDSFVHYLVEHGFKVKYLRDDKDEWFDCNSNIKLIWTRCSKLYIQW